MARYQNESIVDSLTGLYNRRFLRKRIAEEVKRIKQKGSLQILFIDINDFKDVNDTRGHSAGDEMLISLADILKRKLRLTDVICRPSGDEFIILFPRTTEKEMNKILERVFVEVDQLNIMLSVGHYDYNPENKKGPVAIADLAMYKAKERHRAGEIGSIVDTIA